MKKSIKNLLFIGTYGFMVTFCIIATSITAKADEDVWYKDLPTASTAEELFGTHTFFTEGSAPKITLPTMTESNADDMLATPSQATSSRDSDTSILKELIVSENPVIIPCNGHSAFVDIIAKIDDDIFVNVTSIVDWESEDNDIADAYNGRISANDQGTTTIKASLAEFSISINVVVEDYIDIKAEIERLRSLRPDSPAGVSSYAITQDERDEIISRAEEMLNLSWTPAKDLIGWNGKYTFPAGTGVTGIPYTQNQPKNAAGFLAVLSASDFYDSPTVNGKKMPRYGNDCSGFLSFSWNIARQTTYTFTEGIKNGTYAQVGSYSASAEKPN